MDIEDNVRKLHKEIRQNIIVMLPERYKKVCLYASVIDGYKQAKGEMFFYYFPSGIIKRNPINVYEIPKIFDFEEDLYAKMEKRLYESIKKLRQYSITIGENAWSNLTIIIEGTSYSVEYNYDDLKNSEFDNYSRHIIWRYKYLDIPIESYSKKEKEIISRYFESNEFRYSKNTLYKENVYEKQVNRVTIYDSVESHDDYIKKRVLEENKSQAKSQLVALHSDLEKNNINEGNVKKDISEQKKRSKNQLLNNILISEDLDSKEVTQKVVGETKRTTKNQLLNF